MAFNPQITVSADLFSHKMVQCVLGVSLHNSETAKRHAFLNLGNGPDRKISIFPLWKLNSYTLKSAINAHWLIFLLIKNTTLFMYFSFLRQIGCLLLLAGNSNSIVSLIQGNNRYGSQPSHSTLPWPLFSWNGTMCHRCVFTQLWDCRKTFFGESGNCVKIVKAVFSSCEKWILAVSNQPEKHTDFSVHHKKNLVKYLSFLTGTRCLPLARKSSHRTVSPDQGKKSYLYTGTLSPDFFLMDSHSVYLVYH